MKNRQATCRYGTAIVLGLLIILSAFSAVEAAEKVIVVVFPPDKVWVEQAELDLAGLVKGPAETVKIGGAGKVKVETGGVFGAIVSLDRGLNRVKVRAADETHEIEVFYTDDPRKNPPPAEFKRLYTHAEPESRACSQCHRLNGDQYDFGRLLPARSNCSECHDDIGQAKHVHGPVGAGVCISCHSPHGTFNRGFVIKADGELCASCHQDRHDEFTGENVHPPLEDGCADCHSPHESENRYQLIHDGDSLASLCFGCHDQDAFMRDSRHSPVEEGDCMACHRPHSSENKALLTAPLDGGALCFECHDYLKEDFEMEYIHAPVEEGCTECHDPHGGAGVPLLREPGGELCAMCHRDYTPEIYEAIDTAKTEHPPVAQGECVICHRPHSSNNASLLADKMTSLCVSCHDALGAVLAANENLHGPVEDGDCAACHNVHGSLFDKLLARFYPVEFYSAYDQNKYDLCFECHNPDIARTRRTETLTGFRDGGYNLHYFHVNNEKGRTCTACHDPHASSQAKHIRDEVPFGAWSYPINLTRTPTGGRCVVGCHAPKKYDRQNPQMDK
jgi:predicted CXXCH cytochrome family protein